MATIDAAGPDRSPPAEIFWARRLGWVALGLCSPSPRRSVAARRGDGARGRRPGAADDPRGGRRLDSRHLPRGAQILKEQYTPELPAAEFAVARIRFAGRLSPEEIRASGDDYLLLASDAYQRFLRPDLTVKEHQRRIGENYRAILDGWRPIAEWVPGDTRLGPILKLYRLERPAAPAAPPAAP